MITLNLETPDGKWWQKKLTRETFPLAYVPEDGPLKGRKFERVTNDNDGQGPTLDRSAKYFEVTPDDENRS